MTDLSKMTINKYKWLFIIGISIILTIPGFYFAKDRESIELTDELRESAPGEFMQLPQGKVHFRLEGSGEDPLVVLVHGFAIPDFLWDHTAQVLVEEGYQVLRFDLYGHGYSDRPEVEYSKELFVKQLKGLVDEIAPDEAFDLVGISLGAVISAEYTVQNPDRVRRLVLEAPFGLGVDISPLHIPGIGEYIAMIGMVDRLDRGLSANFYQSGNMPDWKANYQYQMQINGFRQAMLSILRNILRNDQWETYQRLEAVHQPILLVWGEEDVLAPFSQSDIILQLVPQAKLVAVERAGHLAHQEGASAVDVELLKFLAPK